MTRAEHLFAILSELDGDLIEEAAAPILAALPRRKAQWKRWAALAACLLLVVGVWRFFPRMGSSEAPNEAEPGSAAPAGCRAPVRGDSGDGAPGSENYGNSMKPGSTAGGTAAYALSPVTGLPIELIYRPESGVFLLVSGGEELLLPVGSEVLPDGDSGADLSTLVRLLPNGCVEGEFHPWEHVSYENYLLITFTKAPGAGTYLVVGIGPDGSFDPAVQVFSAPGE